MDYKQRKSMLHHLLVMTLCAVLGFSFLTTNSYAKESHEHTEECYAKEGDVLCTIPESEGHTHGEECYSEQKSLICEQEENEEHTHSDECYTVENVLTCTQEESEGHTHDEDCFAKGGELICEEEVETLSDDSNEVSDFESLKQAIADATDSAQIVLTDNIEFSETIVIPEGKSIEFVTKDKDVTITSTTNVKNASMIQVEAGATFTLNGDITIDGSHAQGYVKTYGAFIMNKGVLTGSNVNTSDYRLGGVTVIDKKATFTLNGGSIENTTSSYGHKGAVYVSDKAKFIMNGGLVQNNTFSNQFCAAVVIDDSSFEMNGGEITGNKTEISQIQSGGGVLVMGLNIGTPLNKNPQKVATFTMNGGKITNNQSNRGGGVYVLGGSLIYTDLYSEAYFTMNGGEISGNSTSTYTATGTNIQSAGGGVYVEWAGQVTMNGGSISNNSTDGMGGGVATNDAFTNYFGKNPYSSAGNKQYNGLYYRDWDKIFPASFEMNGGSINGNKAMSTSVFGDEGCGGGIYIASNNVVLNAGDISNNQSGKQGGGVYVGSTPYVLTMKNALITENSASVIGGGIWICPTGEIDVSVNNGSGVFNNTANDAADDFAAVHTISNYYTTISDRMLGGGLANWYQDGAIDTSTILGYASANVARYDATSDDNVPVSKIKESNEGYALKSLPSKEAQESAKALATLTITGNSSRRGGGVGSNGGITVGDTFDVTQDLTINKEWFGSDNLPDSITVWVLVNGVRTEKAIVTKEENWTKTVTGLPVGDDISITVEEEQLDAWNPTYSYETDENGDIIATIKNTFDKKITLSVDKRWRGDNSKNRPKSVTVQLYKDGKAYGDVVELSKENKWKYQWTDLDATSTWTVDEVNVPEGYTKTITHKDNAWIITNTSTDVPPTGFNSNKTMWTIMMVASCIVLLMGIIIREKKIHE